MAKIDLLRTNINSMSEDQLMHLVRKVREDRKIRKAPEKIKKAAGKKKQDMASKLALLMKDMSEEEKAAFLADLEKEDVDV